MTVETKYRLTTVIMLVGAGLLIWSALQALQECDTVEAVQQARVQDQARIAELTARAQAAEREVGVLLASQVAWHTKGNGPLDLPSLTPEQVKARLIPEATVASTAIERVEAEPVAMAQSAPIPPVEPSRLSWAKAAASETWQQARRYVWSGWRVP